MKRISDKELDVIIQKLVRKTDKANQLFLKKIGNDIKKIKKLNYTQAHQLIQMLKYGSSYNKVVDEMGKLTNISQKDINSVFSNYAKIDQEFYKQFYQYKNKPYIPYSKNDVLRRQTEALANISGEELRNLTRSRAIGYRITDSKGVTKFKGLRETYEQLLDEAMLNVGQGKDTFDSAIRKILKEIGGSGLRYLDYESGRSIRLDSMIQMHLKDGLRNLHNVNDELFGQEFGSDGVEISVHENPAEDHEEVQGHQFSNEQYIKLQETGIADDYEGNSINIHTFRKDGTMAGFRPISQYNCYHYRFSILLGVNKPEFSKERLEAIKERNDKGFEFEGKHYTMYEGTQLQRKYEREVRKYKDIQILARESDDKELMYEAQRKINELTVNYKKLNDASGLQAMSERMRVSGYHKIKVVDSSIPKEEKKPAKSIVVEPKLSKEELEDQFYMYVGDLSDLNVDVDSSMMLIDKDIRNNQLEQLLNLTEKYPVNIYDKRALTIKCGKLSRANRIGEASYQEKYIALSSKYFKDKNVLLESESRSQKYNWHYKLRDEKDSIIYTLTHEYGHNVEYEYLRRQKEMAIRRGGSFTFKGADKDLRDTLISRAKSISGEKMNLTEFKEKYFSRYAMSKNNYEWFAELFAQLELGEQTPFTEALKEWLEGFYR